MTNALDKLYAIKSTLAVLIDQVKEPERWKRYQDYCDYIEDCFNRIGKLKTRNPMTTKTITSRTRKEKIESEVWNAAQTCQYLGGVCYRTLKNFNIPHRKVGRKELYRKVDVDKWLEGQT